MADEVLSAAPVVEIEDPRLAAAFADLSAKIAGVHDCVHTQGAATEKALKTMGRRMSALERRQRTQDIITAKLPDTHKELKDAVEDVGGRVEALAHQVGTEDPAHPRRSTGLVGRMIRAEDRLQEGDRWFDRVRTAIIVAGAILGPAGLVLFFVLGPRLVTLFQLKP